MKDVKFPEINETQSAEEKLTLLVEYLWQFHQAVAHELSNLSPENFNEKTMAEMAQAVSDALGLEVTDETTET